MKKIVFSFLFCFFSIIIWGQSQIILNQGPNNWTLVLKGKRINLGAFDSYQLTDNSDSLAFYALEIVDETVYAHGFSFLKPDEQGYYVLQNLEIVPIFLLNLQEKEILIESHRISLVLYPGEQRRLKNAYVTHDSFIELKVSVLEDDLFLPQSSWHQVFFKDGKGIVKLE